MVAEVFLFILVSYLVLGLVFSFFFFVKGAKILDPVVAVSGFSFRLLLVPASILLWPFLLKKIFRRTQ